MLQCRTQTSETFEGEQPDLPLSLLIRFFRADDPFDDAGVFDLASHERWIMGRGDPVALPSPVAAHVWSQADAMMSNRHAIIEATTDGWAIADAGSKNGTFVNQTRMQEQDVVQLCDGDIIECGQSFFLYREQPSATEQALPGDSLGNRQLANAPLYYQIAEVLPVAASHLSVHLQGETGSGKEVVARALHNLSERTGAFVARNCAAIPETLFEAELFGYCRGAFTGATTSEIGQIRAAEGGTLFLDEIGELPLSMQAKLLRALELKEVLPLGARAPVGVDFRLVTATLCDLEERVREGRFRQDLHARLGPAYVVPPLREHKEELGRLIRGVLSAELHDRLKQNKSTPRICFTLSAARELVYHAWPYNVRELRHCIASALLGAIGRSSDEERCLITQRDLSLNYPESEAANSLHEELPSRMTRCDSVQQAGRDQALLAALRTARGNRAQAAKLLGVTERTVFRRLRKLREH